MAWSTVDLCTVSTTRSTAATVVGSKIHGSVEPFLFKSPWTFLYLHVGPSTYMNSCKQVLKLMI
jgi:hypothetical protein